jgi:protein phosphatase 1 regulatory subunit 3A/B/C/D/E
MPADYEMLVAHSPPISADFLSSYSSYRLRYEPPACSYNRPRQFGPQLPAQHTSPPPQPHTETCSTLTKMPVAVPRRPCLVVRPEDTSSSSDENELPSPTRLKKKVVFADDKGLSLTQVGVFSCILFLSMSVNFNHTVSFLCM